MQCDTCRRLMPEALDREPELEFLNHLESCDECRTTWRSQGQVDSLLRSEPLAEPPDDFVRSVMASLAAGSNDLPEWRRSLSQIGMISTGVLGIAWLVASLSSHWQLADAVPGLIKLFEGTLNGLMLASGALANVPLRPTIAAGLYITVAATLAAAWFGATILPRDSRIALRPTVRHLG